MKSIVIARHAKSDWSTGLSDHDRPLNGRGREDAPRMGKALQELAFRPDVILSSTAVRARATADAVARSLSFHEGVRSDAQLYEASYGYVLSAFQRLTDNIQNAILFGHNPTLEQLVTYLLQMQGGIVLPTSGMVCLEANIQKWSELQPGQCQLKWFWIPKLLS